MGSRTQVYPPTTLAVMPPRTTSGFLTMLVLGLLMTPPSSLARTRPNNHHNKPRRTQRLTNEGADLGCSADSPPLRMVKYLDRICEDCYHLYRVSEIYQMCRSGCFKNNFLRGCMDVIMVSKSTRSKAESFVSKLNHHDPQHNH